jgi:hypothetical protein
MKTTIDRLLDAVAFRCTICGAQAGTCSCWVQCSCGWSYEKGETCRNPVHAAAKGRR